jgi:hypothetical protein
MSFTSGVDARGDNERQIYGEPGEAVLEMLRRQAGAGLPMTVKRHYLGQTS